MAEAKKSAEDKAEKVVEKPTPPKLAPAAASGDAGVQILLAHRSIHASNGDAARVAEVDAQLAELGFTAQ